MSPRFEVDFTTVDASFPMWGKGRYRLQVTARDAFVGESRPDDEGNVKENAGVKFKIEMVGLFDDDGELQMDGIKGKAVSPYTCWIHSEGGWTYGKPFLMACGGFRRNQNNEANEKLFQKYDWNIDGELNDPPESFTLDDGWDQQVGRLVDVTLWTKQTPNPNDPDSPYENQEYGGWAPVAD